MKESFPGAPPQQPPSPERDPFLEKDLHAVNRSLFQVFAYFDEHRADLQDNDEADEAKRQGSLALAFRSRYGEALFKAALRGEEDRPLSSEDEAAYAEYLEFLNRLDDEKHRPKLLSKMCYMEAGETQAEQAKTWPERQAFTRLLYEFYGREKVIGEDERGQERGFLSLEGQADLVEAWNLKQNWGFTEREFDDIRNEIPGIRERMKNYEDEPLVAPVLTPYLPEKDGKTGVERTFEELWKLTAVGQQRNFRRNDLRSGPDNLRLHPNAARRMERPDAHEPGLELEILGLGDDQGQSPAYVRAKTKTENHPHASILAAAATNPEWVESMNGSKVPYVNLTGYEATVPYYAPWRSVPYLYFRRVVREVLLNAYGDGIASGNWSAPSFRE